MEKALRYTEVLSSLAKKATVQRVDSALDSLALLDRSSRVRRLMDLAMRGIDVEPLPASLYEDQATILVSNYPSVSQSLRAVIKVGCRLSTDRPRLKAIARPEIVTEATLPMKVLGVGRFVFPVHKDQAGAYRLQAKLVKEVLVWLHGPGNVLWLSITGRTRGNGLLEGDLRTGAALFSLKRGVPLLPMGLVTKEKKGRPRVIGVRFADPIYPPSPSELDDFGRTDYLIDLTKLAMCQVARLLPSGQRGDFENAEEKLAETQRRLGMD
jgi:hypothetical protein